MVGIPDVLFDCGPSDFGRHTAPVSMPYYRLMLGEEETVITASKSALISHGAKLTQLARENGSWIGLSAASGAPLHGLDLLRNSVIGCTIERIEVYLNATKQLYP